ncbi:MAG: chemotaxis protein CheB [Chitinophagaceae bacterium]
MSKLKVNSRVIVIGASAGGLDALKKIIAGLPHDFPHAIFVVWHLAPSSTSMLPVILNKLNTLPAAHAIDNEPLIGGRIYVAPPDRHLVIEKNLVRVTRGPKENMFRPAIDPLFRSAAYYHRERVTGIILSGAMDDGTAGLWNIKYRGGFTIVQEPDEAEEPSMPANALRAVQVDLRLPAAAIAGALQGNFSAPQKISFELIPDENLPENGSELTEIAVALEKEIPYEDIMALGQASRLSCPECHGVLSAIQESGRSRFRCHTGHAYSANSLLAGVGDAIEISLWNSLRAAEEKLFLLNMIGDEYAALNQPAEASVCFSSARRTQHLATVIKYLAEQVDTCSIEAFHAGLEALRRAGKTE